MIQSAYNLCDIDIRFFKDAGGMAEDLQRLAEQGTGLIYAGSYFCTNYFLNWTRYAEDLIRMVREAGMSFSAVIPVPSDRTLPAVKDSLIKLDPLVDELIVNDYGTLAACGSELNSPLILGRLFMRQSRDPRYPDLMNSSFRIPFPVTSLKKYQRDYHVAGIEMEGFGDTIDAQELPEGMTFCMHRPWYMMSCDFICEDASAALPIEKKFRPDTDCGMECCGVSHLYQLLNGQVVKVGRGIYALQEYDPSCRLPENSTLRYIEYYPYMEGVTV